MAFSSKQIYSGCSTLSIGCYLYDNPQLTTSSVAGWYRIDGINYYVNASGQIESSQGCDPATSILSVRYEADTFYAELTDAIPSTSITITAATLSVNGYDDSGTCTSLSGDSDFASNNIVINAGSTIDSEPGTYGFSIITTTFYNFPGQLNINGTLRSDGDTFTVGGTSVTLQYPYGAFGGCVGYLSE